MRIVLYENDVPITDFLLKHAPGSSTVQYRPHRRHPEVHRVRRAERRHHRNLPPAALTPQLPISPRSTEHPEIAFGSRVERRHQSNLSGIFPIILPVGLIPTFPSGVNVFVLRQQFLLEGDRVRKKDVVLQVDVLVEVLLELLQLEKRRGTSHASSGAHSCCSATGSRTARHRRPRVRPPSSGSGVALSRMAGVQATRPRFAPTRPLI